MTASDNSSTFFAWRATELIEPLESNRPDLRLRFATDADTALVLEFIRSLAEFEKLAHEVTADEETLRESLFGDRKFAEVIIADYRGTPAGFALFFHNYSTFIAKPGIYLEDLYVKSEFRGNGIGRELLSCLARIAVSRNCGRLEWWVLDWNEDAIGFYKELGGRPMDDWTVFRVSGNSLTRLAGSKE